MSDGMSTIRMNSIFNSLKWIAVIGALAYGISQFDRCASSVKGTLAEKSRKDVINNVLDGGNYVEASTALSNIVASGKVSEETINLLKSRVNRIRMDEERRIEKEKMEKVKKENLDSLQKLIDAGHYDPATNRVAELKGRKIISDSEAIKFEREAHANTLDEMLESVEKLDGMDKIKHIEKLVKIYPKYEKVSELKKMQLEQYLSVANSYFSVSLDPTKVSEMLEDFQQWIKSQKPEIIRGRGFFDFFLNGNRYILGKTPDSKDCFHVGDKVRIARTMDTVDPTKESRKGIFHYGRVDESKKIGKVGVIKSVSDDRETFTIYDEEGNSSSYLYRELEPVEIKINLESLADVRRKFDGIRKYVEGVVEDGRK